MYASIKTSNFNGTTTKYVNYTSWVCLHVLVQATPPLVGAVSAPMPTIRRTLHNIPSVSLDSITHLHAFISKDYILKVISANLTINSALKSS